MVTSYASPNYTPYFDDHVIQLEDTSTTFTRGEDQRLFLNFCSAVSVSTVDVGNETELVSAPNLPSAFGTYTVFSTNAINSAKIIQSSNSQSPKYTKIQPIITPLFAPGVLFNTIKSGVACDYPLMTDNINRVLATVSSSTEGTSSFWMIGSRTAATSSFLGTADYFVDNGSSNSDLLGGSAYIDGGGNNYAYLKSSAYTTAKGELGVIGQLVRTIPMVFYLKTKSNANQFRGFNLRIPF